jgi:hypothetical protein
MKNIDKILISKAKKLIGLEYDSTLIPDGIFCYEYDKITTDVLIDEWNNGFYVKVCPYHKKINEKWSLCMYSSELRKDNYFKDKNKICNKNKHA